MKRLNNDELDARIHNFLERKTQEFPDLEPENFIESIGAPTRNNVDTFRNITHRFGFHWHNSPHTV